MIYYSLLITEISFYLQNVRMEKILRLIFYKRSNTLSKEILVQLLDNQEIFHKFEMVFQSILKKTFVKFYSISIKKNYTLLFTHIIYFFNGKMTKICEFHREINQTFVLKYSPFLFLFEVFI